MGIVKKQSFHSSLYLYIGLALGSVSTIILFLLMIITQSCSTAITVIDTTASVTINTVKGVAHFTTCPFTKKKCF